MAVMVLVRLPTEVELESSGGIEAHSFLNAFRNMTVSGYEGLAAHVEDKGETVSLDGWIIEKSDWFSVLS